MEPDEIFYDDSDAPFYDDFEPEEYHDIEREIWADEMLAQQEMEDFEQADEYFGPAACDGIDYYD